MSKNRNLRLQMISPRYNFADNHPNVDINPQIRGFRDAVRGFTNKSTLAKIDLLSFEADFTRDPSDPEQKRFVSGLSYALNTLAMNNNLVVWELCGSGLERAIHDPRHIKDFGWILSLVNENIDIADQALIRQRMISQKPLMPGIGTLQRLLPKWRDQYVNLRDNGLKVISAKQTLDNLLNSPLKELAIEGINLSSIFADQLEYMNDDDLKISISKWLSNIVAKNNTVDTIDDLLGFVLTQRAGIESENYKFFYKSEYTFNPNADLEITAPVIGFIIFMYEKAKTRVNFGNAFQINEIDITIFGSSYEAVGRLIKRQLRSHTGLNMNASELSQGIHEYVKSDNAHKASPVFALMMDTWMQDFFIEWEKVRTQP